MMRAGALMGLSSLAVMGNSLLLRSHGCGAGGGADAAERDRGARAEPA